MYCLSAFHVSVQFFSEREVAAWGEEAFRYYLPTEKKREFLYKARSVVPKRIVSLRGRFVCNGLPHRTDKFSIKHMTLCPVKSSYRYLMHAYNRSSVKMKFFHRSCTLDVLRVA